jgi:hypothetical protein
MPKLSPRQKLCSKFAKDSLDVNREKQAFLPMREEETIGELGLDATELFSVKEGSIRFLENGLEPQTTNAQQPFLASIRSIHLISMPVMHTTAPQMRPPPHREKHHEKPAIQMITVREAAAFYHASSAFLILKRGFDFHTLCIVIYSFMRSFLVRYQKPCFLSRFPTRAEPAFPLMLLPQQNLSIPVVSFFAYQRRPCLPIAVPLAKFPTEVFLIFDA